MRGDRDSDETTLWTRCLDFAVAPATPRRRARGPTPPDQTWASLMFMVIPLLGLELGRHDALCPHLCPHPRTSGSYVASVTRVGRTVWTDAVVREVTSTTITRGSLESARWSGPICPARPPASEPSDRHKLQIEQQTVLSARATRLCCLSLGQRRPSGRAGGGTREQAVGERQTTKPRPATRDAR